jgi:hypothetical protein
MSTKKRRVEGFQYGLILLLLVVCGVTLLPAEEFPWQDPKIKVLPTGDLQWDPQPFQFTPGKTLRYIDYENGDDNNTGASKDSPWKHHPWDARAGGKAKDFSGVATYIFKRGVYYRFASEGGKAILRAEESGEQGEPIRLTSDPSWGTGEAVLAGSMPIEGPWKKATASDAPERMDVSGQTVWYVDMALPKKPGGRGTVHEAILFEVQKNGEITDLHLASDAGWEIQNPHFAMDHWNTWDEFRRYGKRGGLYHDAALQGKDQDYYEGGTVWSQYAWVIANPTPDNKPLRARDYNSSKGGLRYKKGNEPVNPGTRYLVENLPQFLDSPREYYYDKSKERLFVRLPNDRNPNSVRVEISTAFGLLQIENQHHIEISGLSFRFTGRPKKAFWVESNVIDILGNSSNITVKNCEFSHTANDCIQAHAGNNNTMDHINVMDCDFEWINGGTAIDIEGSSGKVKQGETLGRLHHAKVLRNRIRNIGLYRHDDHKWSNVQALNCSFVTIAEIAGNVVEHTWGSGIVSMGGTGGKSHQGFHLPLGRILVHHNKTEYNAIAVNDYGGLSLWQHGPMYAFNNVVGNSVGFWPGGFFNKGDQNLSYPVYLDGGFKIACFNNIIWGLPYQEDKVYTKGSSAYFNVFGYMNPFINNTVFGTKAGFGGTSGNRNEYIGNLFADIEDAFISVNHGGNPSLIGGDDNAESGIDGASTLAYANNVFHGPAKAGVVATVKRGAKKDLEADDLDVLQKQMENYPLRYAQLGTRADSLPITNPIPPTDAPETSDADFRPAMGSPAIDNGATYFLPWALYGTVGEWYFNANHADPTMVLDFHYYPTEAYFNRSMYCRVPVYELTVNDATLEDYIDSDSETWIKGALQFDGKRSARCTHEKMSRDIVLSVRSLPKKPLKKNKLQAPWQMTRSQATYPGEKRITLDMDKNNVLVETILQTKPGHTGGVVLGKHDGTTGYRLVINDAGKAEFQVASGSDKGSVVSAYKVNDGKWHHILAEIDREDGRMTMYLDGKQVGETTKALPSGASLSNTADFIVGTDQDQKEYFQGAIDFMRVCRGTLADAETTIEELYAWEFDGPIRRDFMGNPPKGQRDVGALER